MFETEKELLKRICRKSNTERQNALENELRSKGVAYENLDNMAIVVPAKAERKVVLCAHFDAVNGSYGYNDNGMAVVTALQMIGRLSPSVEVVFTNCEEQGGLGAGYYLDHTDVSRIRGCVNLDVVGCFDQVYLDTMNCPAARSLVGCRQGTMPFCDAGVFASEGIPTVCFSSGPAEATFREGIMRICSTLHNHCNDNIFEQLNFEMIPKIIEQTNNAIGLMEAA